MWARPVSHQLQIACGLVRNARCLPSIINSNEDAMELAITHCVDQSVNGRFAILGASLENGFENFDAVDTGNTFNVQQDLDVSVGAVVNHRG